MSKSNDIVETQQINKQSSKYSSTSESARELGNNLALSTSLKMCTFEKIFHQNFTRPTMNSFSSSTLSRQGGRERERWIDRQTDREREREGGSRESSVSGSCRPFCAIVARCFECSRTLENTRYCPAPGDPTITRIEIPISSASLLLPAPGRGFAACVCVRVCAQPKPNATGIAWKRVEYHSTRI